MNEKPSKQQIVDHLKRADWLTVVELSEKVGVTPMAIRQHLMSLDRQGLIRYAVKKRGIGRPVYMYRLTDRAENIFPKNYGKFINEIFHSIESSDGKKKLDKVLKLRNQHLREDKYGVILDLDKIDDKVVTLAEIQNQEGFMVELENITDYMGYMLKQFNCPLVDVANAYPEICKFELELYRSLIGPGVQRETWMIDGDSSCQYRMPTV